MSGIGPPQPPLSYFGPPARQEPWRPLSVSIIAWFAIVGSCLMLLSPLCLLLPFVNPNMNPMLKAIEADAFWRVYVVVTQILGFSVHAVLLYGGIQALRLRPVGRKIIIAYAVYSVVMGAVGAMMNILVFNPIMAKSTPFPLPPFWNQLQIVFAIIGVLIWAGVAGVVIYFMTRAKVIEAFNRPPDPPMPMSLPPQ